MVCTTLDNESPIQAVCPNWARTDLCGGRLVTAVPTANAGNDETLRRLNWPASKKRQGTKSRAVGHWLAESYVDLMLASISLMGRTPARRHLHVWSHARWDECDRHFRLVLERGEARSAH